MSEQSLLFPEVIFTDPARDLPRSACKGCNAVMIWVKSVGGANVPLDPRPVSDGTLVFEPDATTPTVRYLRKGETVSAGTAKYRSHFSTCPDAAQFRRA